MSAPAESRDSPSLVFLLVLVSITAMAPFAMQIFLPALPAVQSEFGVTTGVVQLVISLSLLSVAVSTLAYGPFSDHFGRRPVLIFGLLVYIAGTALSALAPDIETLIAGRVIQAVGGTCGMVLARAIVRDVFAEAKVATVIAYLTVAMVVAPMVAPALGGVITDAYGWRHIFTVVGVFGAVILIAVVLRLAETRSRPPTHRGARGMLEGMGLLIRESRFRGYAFQAAFAMGVFFTFSSAAPYVMVNVLDRPASEYGFYFIVVSAGFMAGNLTAARLSGRYAPPQLVVAGSLVTMSSALLMTALALFATWSPLALFAPGTLLAYGSGLAMPNAQAGALSVRPQSAGTASGLIGFMQMGMAALFVQIVGVLEDATPYPMVFLMLFGSVLGLAAIVHSLPAHRRAG